MSTPSEETSKPPSSTGSKRLLVALLVLGALVASVLVLGVQRRGELLFKVAINGESFVQGQPIILRLAVQNTSGGPLEVQHWTPFDDPKDCTYFEGNPVELQIFYEHLPEPRYAVPFSGQAPVEALPAGQTIDFRCAISRAFGLARPGEYRIRGTYLREPWARTTWLRPLALLLGAAVRHEEVAFEIKPMAYDTKLPPPPARERTPTPQPPPGG